MHVGVDEAGKGPVLGAMFAAAVRAPTAAIPAGVRDSKALSPDRRSALAERLRADERVSIAVASVDPDRIDDAGTDMTTLTIEAHADALNDVVAAGDAVTIDAADVDAERFGRQVAARVNTAVDVTARHRADETDPFVAAASIIAKVERDAHVSDLAERYGDIGSGYPSDPTTRTYLEKHVSETGSLPECARSSWATAQTILTEAEQAQLDGF